MGKETVEVLIEGGKATAAPPVGPTLSQLKLNVGQVVKDINDKTSGFKGMQVPVKITVDTETKKYDISVGSPPVSAMIKKEMNVKKMRNAKEGNVNLPGDISLDKIIEIAKNKDMSGDLKARVNQVLGTCLSGAVTVDGKNAKEVIASIKSGEIKIG